MKLFIQSFGYTSYQLKSITAIIPFAHFNFYIRSFDFFIFCYHVKMASLILALRELEIGSSYVFFPGSLSLHCISLLINLTNAKKQYEAALNYLWCHLEERDCVIYSKEGIFLVQWGFTLILSPLRRWRRHDLICSFCCIIHFRFFHFCTPSVD